MTPTASRAGRPPSASGRPPATTTSSRPSAGRLGIPLREGNLYEIATLVTARDDSLRLKEGAVPVLLGLATAAVCREGVGLLGMQLGERYLEARERRADEKRRAREAE